MIPKSKAARFLIVPMVLAIVALPLLLVGNLPFVDYPNHLARYYILQHLSEAPELARFYISNSGFYPYWALRGTFAATAWLVGVEMSGRISAVLALLLPVAGVLCVHWALHRRFSVLPLATIVLAYNELMAWGFQNYLISISMAFIGFAMWIRSDGMQPVVRIAAFAGVLLAITCLHFLAGAAFVMLAGGWTLAGVLLAGRFTSTASYKRLLELVPIILPAAMLVLALRSNDIGGSITMYSGWSLQFTGMVTPLWMGWNKFELMIGVWLSGLTAFAFWTGSVSMSKRSLLLVAMLALCATIAPFALLGVTFINARLPIIFLMLVVASSSIVKPAKKTFPVLICIFVGLAAVKIGLSTYELTRRSELITELRATFGSLEKGRRIFTVIDYRKGEALPEQNHDLYRQVVHYAVVDAHAFTPRLFTMFEVGFTPEFQHLSRPVSDAVNLEFLSKDFEQWPEAGKYALGYARNWRRDYDYLLLIDFDGTAELPAGTSLLHNGSYFRVLKINS